MRNLVPDGLEERIATLVPEVDYIIRSELQRSLRTLQLAGNPIGVLVSMSRLSLLLIEKVFASAGHESPSDNLFSCIISAANGDGIKKVGLRLLPDEMASYLHTIRTLSNKADHASEMVQLTRSDAENALNLYLRVVEWYYCEYDRGPTLESAYFSVNNLSSSQEMSNVRSAAPHGAATQASGFVLRPPSLPQQLTSFIGRQREIQTIEGLLGQSRLLTLTGSGGCGKTRLVLHIASKIQEEFTDGVWLVELAAISDPGLIVQVIAAALGIREEPNRTLLQTMTSHVATKSLILVLDNCEHLIEACATTVNTLLRTSSQLRVLVTSREALNIEGEVTFRVPSLSLPDPKRMPSVDSLIQYEAVQLFIERALAAQPSFTVASNNAPAIAQICHQLDGIPLAIELAAARVRVLTVEQIADRLNDRFKLLTGGRRTALARHQTLHATIEWSYNLLSEEEQALLRRVSVFSSGWTLEAAEGTCTDERIEQWQILDLLTQLLTKSLIICDDNRENVRYSLLETVRQYSREVMPSSEAVSVLNQHTRYYITLAQTAEAELKGENQLTWLNILEIEHDNIRVALDWCLKQNDVENGLKLTSSLWRFWYMHGYTAEGRSWMNGLLNQTKSGVPSVRAKALRGAALLAQCQGDYLSAQNHMEESLEIYTQIDDQEGLARSYGTLGRIFLEKPDMDAARPFIETSLSIFRQLRDDWGIAVSLNNLGIVACDRGDHASALKLFQESLDTSRRRGDQNGAASALDGIGMVSLLLKDDAMARSSLTESIQIWQALGHKQSLALCLLRHIRLAVGLKNFGQVAQLLGQVDNLRNEIGISLMATDLSDFEDSFSEAENNLPQDEFRSLYNYGKALTIDDSVRLCLS